MGEHEIMVENAYMQQNYLIQLCMGYTDRLNELEAKHHKMQAENWHHRAKQLKSANRELHERQKNMMRIICNLRKHIEHYRMTVRDLKRENRELRDKLEFYAELENVLSERK